MNTSALKSFAQQARQLLRERVERRIVYWGFDKKGNNTENLEAVTGGYTFRGKVSNDTSVPGKWNKLKSAISYTSFDEVVEKAAYTWFNRLMAMKILSQNGYETAQLDYLSEETNTPAILEKARRGQYSFLSNAEQKRLQPLLTDYEKEQETFAILLIGFCHQHPLLQGIFGSIDDYSELLLPDNILTENGFLYFLNTTDAIGEEDYKQVELIGWLYQFYISEKKDEVFAGFKQNKKAEAKDIPAATQIFTPNWIVKYLVQNTLGRTWLDAHPKSDLKKVWKYLVESSNDSKELQTTDSELRTADSLTFLDPAVGSGHILVEAFDTLYPMYMAEYYSPEDAVQSILEKNLFGLDLDLRAVQLAQFALILKAAQYSRTVLKGKILPHIYSMPQRRTFSNEEVLLFLGKDNAGYVNQLYKLLQIMEQAHNLGSIMVMEVSEDARKAIEVRMQYWQQKTATNFDEEIIKEVFPTYIPILLILTIRFACIAANPPYMSNKNMNAQLKIYVENNFASAKSDLYSVFLLQASKLISEFGYIGYITQQSWMFLISFEDFRGQLLESTEFVSMVHLGPNTFSELTGEVVQTTALVLRKNLPTPNSIGKFIRLVDFDSSEAKRDVFLSQKNEQYDFEQTKFGIIPGKPIAYWASEKIRTLFIKYKTLIDYFPVKKGIDTGKNELFLRKWGEVSAKKISGFKNSNKWFFYIKGGGYRKWYGNFDLIVNWQNDGSDIRNHPSSTIRNPSFFLKDAVTWSLTSSNQFGARVVPKNCLFDNNGSSVFPENNVSLVSSLLNNAVSRKILSILNPTLAFQVGDISRVPVANELLKQNTDSSHVQLAKASVNIVKQDWDSRELSWEFQTNQLFATKGKNIEQSFQQWLQKVSIDFFQLLANEEQLNRIFIEMYGLQDELKADVPLKDITILQEELDFEKLDQLQRPYKGQLAPVNADVVMQQLISYAVGCYMGRYRLDKPGLHIAHPNPTEEELVPYAVTTGDNKNFLFSIDDDAITPLMGKNGNFTDDMLNRINEFLAIVWGDDTLTANLNFLQKQLGKDLEEYLVKDFWKYHTRTYSKKPIYWLFASKKGAFQVLVYMHRMNAYTTAHIRTKYLIPHISWLQGQVRDMEKKTASLSKVELKTLDTRRKQLAECEEYDLLLKDIADKQISFDLDEGMTKNYALFEGVVAVIK